MLKDKIVDYAVFSNTGILLLLLLYFSVVKR
jgi:hypothetical protein